MVENDEVMKRKCPKCGKEISYLEVSKQIEGYVELSDIKDGKEAINWKSKEEQREPVIHSCPECLSEIDDETLIEWGLT